MKTKLNTYYPYLLGLFILHGLILVIIGVVRCDYWGDYIHHVGAIRELALHPLHPVHPQLGINAMTPFFTPYHFFVAMLQRITNIDTYKLLSYFGILNYLFLMASICLFVKKLFKSKMAVLLYVFFMLYLWGFPTLDFSGFTHLKVIGSVASYHSTLSNAMVYLTLYLFMKYVETKKIIYLPMQALSIALCVIPNPVNAPVMYVAYVLLVATYSFYNSWDKKILITGGLVVFVSLALWALWPYASLIEIIRARGMSQTLWPRSGFSNMKSIFGALLPTIVGVSILMPLNTKNKENTWIYLSFIAFLMIYIFGVFLSNFNLQRSIQWIVVALHLAITANLTEYCNNHGCFSKFMSCTSIRRTACIIFAGVALSSFALMTYRTTKNVLQPTAPPYGLEQFRTILEGVDNDSVIMADFDAGYRIPTISGKVVAHMWPETFVHNYSQRQGDLVEFYNENTTEIRRQEILRNYQVQYILLSKSKLRVGDERTEMSMAQFRDISNLGKVVKKTDDLFLIQVN